MEKRKVGVISLCVLLAAYLLFRYPLFELHGMKQFPLVLFIIGAAVIVVFGIWKGGRLAPLYTTVGYIVGFILGCLLQNTFYDPGSGTLNDFWKFWWGGFIAATVAGILQEVQQKKDP